MSAAQSIANIHQGQSSKTHYTQSPSHTKDLSTVSDRDYPQSLSLIQVPSPQAIKPKYSQSPALRDSTHSPSMVSVAHSRSTMDDHSQSPSVALVANLRTSETLQYSSKTNVPTSTPEKEYSISPSVPNVSHSRSSNRDYPQSPSIAQVP